MNEHYYREQKHTLSVEMEALINKRTRSETTLEKIRAFILFSYFFTGPCLLFMFLAPKETVAVFVFFALITGGGHFISYIQRIEIKELKLQSNKRHLEFTEIETRYNEEQQKISNRNAEELVLYKQSLSLLKNGNKESEHYKKAMNYIENRLNELANPDLLNKEDEKIEKAKSL